jgi:hypothetical protein
MVSSSAREALFERFVDGVVDVFGLLEVVVTVVICRF